RRGMNGHFEVNATINGHTTPMISDTGASAVVLTIADARAAGVNVEGLRYTVPVSTANGQGLAARTRLDSIEVGGIVRRNLTAFVTEEGALETSLQDRKSTRLNSSHVKISYAGFCLKKK